MKLTLDARLIKSSGIGVYLQNIIQSGLLNNFEVTLLHKTSDIDFFLPFQARAKLIPFDADLYSIREIIQTPAKTRESDVFWSPHYNVPVVNFASKLKVVTIHDVFHLAYYSTLSSPQKLYAKLMLKKAISSDLIFTVSNTSKAEIVKYTGCKPEKIKVVYNGIDYKKFSSGGKRDSQGLSKYNISFPYILFVGNVKPHKNLTNALLGFKEFLLNTNSHYFKHKFVIAGKREGFITGDTEVNKLMADPVLKDRIFFTGWVEDNELPILYRCASAFVFPSLYEGFGFPALEAMAAGCPVISSNSSCMPEIYGDAALFFNPYNPVEIGEALFTIITDTSLREQQIAKGLDRARKYNWDETVKKKTEYINGYTATLDRSCF